MFFRILLFTILCFKLEAYVDVSFLIVDMKYSNENGIQICEIQHGVDSAFKGEAFTNGGKSMIAENLLSELNKYYPLSWALVNNIADLNVKARFRKDEQWQEFI